MLYQLISAVLFALTADTIGILLLKLTVKINSDEM
jgi:hypothetical protein